MMIESYKNISRCCVIILVVSMVVFSFKCKYYSADELYPADTICDTTNTTYTTGVSSIFQANCYVCHSTAIASGGVILDTYQDAIIPAQNGLLWKVVSHEPGFPIWMPLNLPQLPQCDLTVIQIWINKGEPL